MSSITSIEIARYYARRLDAEVRTENIMGIMGLRTWLDRVLELGVVERLQKGERPPGSAEFLRERVFESDYPNVVALYNIFLTAISEPPTLESYIDNEIISLSVKQYFLPSGYKKVQIKQNDLGKTLLFNSGAEYKAPKGEYWNIGLVHHGLVFADLDGKEPSSICCFTEGGDFLYKLSGLSSDTYEEGESPVFSPSHLHVSAEGSLIVKFGYIWYLVSPQSGKLTRLGRGYPDNLNLPPIEISPDDCSLAAERYRANIAKRGIEYNELFTNLVHYKWGEGPLIDSFLSEIK